MLAGKRKRRGGDLWKICPPPPGIFRAGMFDSYAVKNLHKMRRCIKTNPLSSFTFDFVRAQEIIKQIREAINRRYKKRLRSKSRSLLIARFVSSKIDLLKIESELHSAKNLIPVQLRATFEAPMVAWYYPQTLGQTLFNYKHFVKSNNVDKLVQIAQGECECHRNQDFINPDHGHIMTCDVNVLRHTQLQNLVAKGTKHRWWSKEWEREGLVDGGCPIISSMSNALNNWRKKFARDNEMI